MARKYTEQELDRMAGMMLGEIKMTDKQRRALRNGLIRLGLIMGLAVVMHGITTGMWIAVWHWIF